MTIYINGTTGISGVDGSAGTPALQGTDTNTGISFPAADTIAFNEGGVEAARIDSSGRLLVGTTNSANNTRLDQKLAIVSTGADNYAGMAITSYSGTSAGPAPFIDFNRSRGTTDGSYTEVVNNDTLGYLVFRGADGVGWSEGVGIIAYADGDWTTSGDTSDSPGRLGFYTTADGSNTITERMRIASTGAISSVIPGGITLYPNFACRAWVNFNGTGTVAIRASGNVSSITDNGVGDYTINLTTSMPDADYAIVNGKDNSLASSSYGYWTTQSQATSNFRMHHTVISSGSTFGDAPICMFAVFR